ncbi:MAG: porin [Gammaproteobacteria bacterium]|nr:porin [Gammaproteobacteria bacterium]MCP4089398.1 porin [Gammaproteobacteria bacterium]MCP4277513.1 porin [Gammaproteobacteria bacterium]MCP4831121.1 porin [Gammaproteobacteria bacterium]MCP4928545.1 porin [Gammaproteobacteria bacterium]
MRNLTLLVLLAIPVLQAQAQTPAPGNISELWEIIQQQQAEINSLKSKDAKTKQELAETREKVSANEQRVNATDDAIDTMANSQSTLASWAENTQIGGYGEMHYNNLDAKDSSKDVKEIDLHRFVLYFNHQFNDDLRFFSELEVEHSIAGDDQNGEVELEQAYLQYDLNDNHTIQGGLFLVPVGIINENHEPNTFYGVERNSVEKIIIPTTWWEGGAALSGHYENGLSWDFAMTSGLEMSNNYQIRKGRQKVSKASANDPAYTARLKYTGVPGLELAASYQLQVNAAQGKSSEDIGQGQLISTHAIYNKGPLSVRALWADWDFDGDDIKAAGANNQSGWYVEPSWKFSPGNYDIGIYARYENLDGYAIKGDTDEFQVGEFDEWQVGISYWPVENVVIKFDYRERDYDEALTAATYDFTGIDLGLGYSF